MRPGVKGPRRKELDPAQGVPAGDGVSCDSGAAVAAGTPNAAWPPLPSQDGQGLFTPAPRSRHGADCGQSGAGSGKSLLDDRPLAKPPPAQSGGLDRRCRRGGRPRPRFRPAGGQKCFPLRGDRPRSASGRRRAGRRGRSLVRDSQGLRPAKAAGLTAVIPEGSARISAPV